MSALAASCSQAIRSAAKGMKLDDVRVEVTHDADTTFTRHITLYGDLTDEQVQTLRAAGAASTVDGYIAAGDITTTVDTATVEQRRKRDKQR